jgi:peptidoglycan/xylan/chitin deacetylase (PgdA/CDA1 family)
MEITQLRDHLINLLVYSKIYSVFPSSYGGIGSILLFHRVIPANGTKKLIENMEVTPEYLEACITFFLEHDYQILSLDAIYEILKTTKIKNKFIAFTFDDGYIDIFRYIYPLFKKYNIPFTVYVTPGFQDQQAIMWWEFLQEIVLKSECLRYPVDDTIIVSSCKTWREKKMAINNILEFFKKLEYKDFQKTLHKIFDNYEYDYHKKQQELILSWDQILTLSKDPNVSIGAHSLKHPKLNSLSGTEALFEIVKSKEIIESRINKKVEHFSYPHGSRAEVGKREFAITKECGFKTATTTRIGNIFFEHKKHLECLPRIQPKIIPKEGIENVRYLPLWMSGFVPAMKHFGKRVITE